MAISWCLYKKPGTGNTPLYGKGNGTDKETVVVVSLPEEGIVVKRVSPKTILSVTLTSEGVVLENEEAQIFINRRFGKEHVWRTCNYVSQGTINHLMSGELTDSQRWDVLYTLAFESQQDTEGRGVTIDALKNGLRSKLEETDRKLQKEQQLTETHRLHLKTIEGGMEEQTRELEALLDRDHPVMDISQEEFNGFYYEMQRIPDRRVTEEEVREAEERSEGVKVSLEGKTLEASTLETTIRGLEAERDLAERDLRRDLQEAQGKRSTAENELEKLTKELSITSRLHRLLENIFETVPPLKETVEGLPDRVERLQRLLTRVLWLQGRNWEFISREDAQKMVRRAKTLTEKRTKRSNLEQQLSAAETKVLRLEPRLGKFLPEQSSWTVTLESLQESFRRDGEVMRFVGGCPCCSQSLLIRYTPKEILSVESVASQKETLGEDKDMETLKGVKLFDKTLISAVRERDELRVRLIECDSRAEDVEGEGLSNELINAALEASHDVDEWVTVPEGLRNICLRIVRYCHGKINLAGNLLQKLQEFTAKNDRDEKELEAEVDRRRGELRGLNERVAALKGDLELIDDRHRQNIRKVDLRLRELNREIKTLQTTLHKLEVEGVALKAHRSWWSRLENFHIRDKEHLRKLHVTRKEASRINATLDGLRKRFEEETGSLTLAEKTFSETVRYRGVLAELQSDLETVESTVLQECVDRVSSQTNAFLENAFDNPVMVNLVTEREARGGKSKRHSVGITVKSGKSGATNLVERSLDGFSGGETDRISLGFSNAITTFSSFPLLMLDECISSLDTEMKDKVIRALRQQAKVTNKTIVLVCHDAVDGLFDHVCEVE
jgi:DNA repair exonuclease SbcCD ATPase subunit